MVCFRAGDRAPRLTSGGSPWLRFYINVVTEDERHTLWNRPPQKYEAYLGFHGKRIARVLTEAYMQDGLLSFSELQ